ncbi:unnamed protein product [Victoria cruziana]
MTRVRRGYIVWRHRRKIHLFASSFRGAHSRLIQTSTQQKIRALVSSHRGGGRQKRDFCRLWITRINVVTRENGKQLLLNRKILAQIAISNRNCLYMISNDIIK